MLGSVGYGKHGSKGSWVLWKVVKGVACDEGQCTERERERERERTKYFKKMEKEIKVRSWFYLKLSR